MEAVVTYDVSGRQTDVKNNMIGRGYSDAWKSSNVTYHLPNTTLWKGNVASLDTALADIKAAAAACGVTLERAVAFSSTPWAGIPGLPH
jgi:hypothetical protein